MHHKPTERKEMWERTQTDLQMLSIKQYICLRFEIGFKNLNSVQCFPHMYFTSVGCRHTFVEGTVVASLQANKADKWLTNWNNTTVQQWISLRMPGDIDICDCGDQNRMFSQPLPQHQHKVVTREKIENSTSTNGNLEEEGAFSLTLSVVLLTINDKHS